jgi:hypothetical protein
VIVAGWRGEEEEKKGEMVEMMPWEGTEEETLNS